mgnify:CR=1 FL=1
MNLHRDLPNIGPRQRLPRRWQTPLPDSPSGASTRQRTRAAGHHRATWTLVFTLVATFALAGCSGTATTSSDHSREVSRDTFEGTWPFTVSEGTLECNGSAVTFTTDGVTYGVNGTSLSDHARPEAIWQDAEGGLQVDMSDMIDAGLALCE